MKIAIACDHGGYLLKQDILIWLEENDIDYEDFGCYSTESVDYPVFAERPPGRWPPGNATRAS
jgi:ribose 5-phosphate isomerase B